ncbi:extracellular solute-binding protein [Nesterenkonia pannonica]|uniref:extracellular solute-binding protein n=1 Tax=Nesterenkonia pannonica TaxID=1548602 RepID=UPI002164E7B8|nr:extracellular solute-binding protein [Nesterenkonia pannonica]
MVSLMWLQYLTDRHGGEEQFTGIIEDGDSWNNESVLFALETMQDLGENGGYIDTYNGIDAAQNEDAQLLADGQAAMLLQGSWVYATINMDFPEFADSGNFGFTTFPELEDGEGDPSNLVGNPANYWSVSADAPEVDQQDAMDYISEHLYNDEAVDTMLDLKLPSAAERHQRPDRRHRGRGLPHLRRRAGRQRQPLPAVLGPGRHARA